METLLPFSFLKLSTNLWLDLVIPSLKIAIIWKARFPLIVDASVSNGMDGFWLGVATSLTATLVVIVLGWFGRGARRVLKFYSRFTLAGIWIGTCKLPSYPENVEAIEIYRLTIVGDQINFNFFNYRSDGVIQKYLGGGIYRGHLLSAYYYIPDADKSESGVFVVRKSGETLKGLYAQYDLRAGEVLKVSGEDFILTRIRIPWWRSVKLRLGWRPYKTHTEVKELYDKSPKTIAVQQDIERKRPLGRVASSL